MLMMFMMFLTCKKKGNILYTMSKNINLLLAEYFFHSKVPRKKKIFFFLFRFVVGLVYALHLLHLIVPRHCLLSYNLFFLVAIKNPTTLQQIQGICKIF